MEFESVKNELERVNTELKAELRELTAKLSESDLKLEEEKQINMDLTLQMDKIRDYNRMLREEIETI